MRYASTYKQLAEFGKKLLEKKSLTEGLPHISKYAKEIINADRCSIYIHNPQTQELWTPLADSISKLVIPSDKGLVGETLKTKKPIIANDPYSHPSFLPEIDKGTGYKTTSVITSPIFNSKREIIGVLQLLNKENGFDNEDARFMIFFSHYVSGYLELVNIYKDQDKIEGTE